MGGHGGLNILPQKKWNVYRKDNRKKVIDDEREYKLDQKKKKIIYESRILEEKIDILKNSECKSTSVLLQSSNINNENCEELNILKNKNPSDVENDYFQFKGDSSLNHFNFFQNEQKYVEDLENNHKKYLSKIGHCDSSVSDFDCIKSSKPWYLEKNYSYLLNEPRIKNNKYGNNVLIKKKIQKTNCGKKKKGITKLREERLKRELNERIKENRVKSKI